MMTPSPITPHLRHLVLVGGGHAQIAVLKKFAMAPMPGLRLTLISRDVMTPYSGMLPGYIEGVYGREEITLDLSHLARHAGARFIHDEISSIDPEARTIGIKGRPPLSYDLMSINIGASTDLDAITGAREHAIGIKPISTLLPRLDAVLDPDMDAPHLLLAGGGAAGVETALALDERLNVTGTRRARITLVHRGERLAAEYPQAASRMMERELASRGIDVRLQTSLDRVEPGMAILDGDEGLAADLILVITPASPPAWLAGTSLALDERGFIAVNRSLQSISHPEIFAAGDIATLEAERRPKAGVFAVRAGPYLAENLRRALLGQRLKSWHPQRNYLALVGTGGGRALAVRGNLVVPGSAAGWHLKEWIDRRFMKRFSAMREMPAPPPPQLARQITGEGEDPALADMRCLGCAAKAGWASLDQALAAARNHLNEIAPGMTEKSPITEDSAMTEIGGMVMVQSIDALTAMVDDPFLLGRIAALHALSDLYASNATPINALALLTLPPALARLQQDDITQILAGAMLALAEENTRLVGGHTSESHALQVGFSVTGTRPDDLTLAEVKDGDGLVLTKPLGTGMIMAAHARGIDGANGEIRRKAIDVMSLSNGGAAALLARHGPFMMTDVTGFGLARHLRSLLDREDGRGFSAECDHHALPVIPGVTALAGQGVRSSLAGMNERSAPLLPLGEIDTSLYHDPQTGGGLLAVVPRGCIGTLMEEAEKEGIFLAEIGRVRDDGLGQIRIRG
ncbi:selenide, water dikinase SelD [Alphaproteobacteria bacterium LSUCC0684]